MRISDTLLAILFGLCTNLAFAQALAFEWGKPSPSDLGMEVYAQDSSAQAVILHDYGQHSISRGARGFENTFYHFRRIKILDRRAIEELGNVQISFYRYKNTERLGILKAQVIQPDGKVEKLSKKQVFHEEINEYWSQVSFSFPNVQVGSIIEYQYRVFSDQIFQTKPWFFRHSYPVRYSEYQFSHSKALTYLYLLGGVDYLDKVSEIKDGKETYMLGDMSLLVHHTTFIASNVTAIQEDPYLYCLNDYRTNITFQLYEIFQNAMENERLMQSWPQVAAELEESNSFGALYSRPRLSKSLRAAAENEVDRAAPIPQRIQQIHRFLRKHIQTNRVYGIYAAEEPDKIFAAGMANQADMTLAGISLLRHFDIPAYPLITSTRAHGKLLPDHAVMNQFNYVLAGVSTAEGMMPVDFATPKLPVGWVPLSILGRPAFVVDKDSARWVDLPEGTNRIVFSAKVALDEGGNVAGEVEIRHSKYGSYLERGLWLIENPNVLWQERLTENMPTALMKDLRYVEPTNDQDPVHGTFQLSVPEAAILNDDLMYLSPILYSNFQENPFKLPKRTYPIDFPYEISEHYLLEIKIPEGWTIEELPKSSRISMADKKTVFQYTIEEQEGYLKLISYLSISKLHFPPKEYQDLRDLLDHAAEKLNEQIILRKK